jgi:predicted TIM-barrel fold metal-dependent hydrolase
MNATRSSTAERYGPAASLACKHGAATLGGTVRIISSDSHVIEPPTVWEDHVEAAYRDRVPRVVRDADTDRLVCEGLEFPPFALFAGCLRSDDEVRQTGRWQEDIPLAAYDPAVRRRTVEADGVSGEVLFPTVAMSFYLLDDVGLQQALFAAYNRWIAELCASAPDFYRGLAALNVDDVGVAVAELERAHAAGLRGAMVPLFASEEQPYHSAVYEPLWEAAAGLGMPLNFHSATTRARKAFWTNGRLTERLLRAPTEMMHIALDLVFGGVFDRHPSLTVVSAENDLGWAGFVAERGDYWWQRNRSLTTNAEQMRNERPPSSYFGANLVGTFMRDRTAVLSTEVIGADAIAFGTDFPHHVSTWPRTVELVERELAGVDDAGTREAILAGNVERLYGRFGAPAVTAQPS